MRHKPCQNSLFLSQDTLKDIIHRLSNTTSDENTGIQEFSIQNLMALKIITTKLGSNILIGPPPKYFGR